MIEVISLLISANQIIRLWQVKINLSLKKYLSEGDLDNNDIINVLDVITLIYLILDIDYSSNYICNGDINNDFGLNISDIIYLTDLIFER